MQPAFTHSSNPFPNTARSTSVSHFTDEESILDPLYYLPNIV